MKNLIKKLNIKITWKSVVGFATLVGGVITQAVASNALPGGASKILISVGAGLLAFERIADAIDYRSDSQFNSALGVPPTTATPTTSSTPST